MKRLISSLAVVSFIVAAVWTLGFRARAGADEKTVPEDRLRVTVKEILHEDTVRMTLVGIDTLPGSWVEVTSDKPNRGGTAAASPKQAQSDGTSHTQVTLFADHVEWKAGSTNALKFMMKVEAGAGTATSSETGPMPDAKRLADVLKVLIKPGEYQYGVASKLVTFKDVTYSLVVKRPQ